MNLKLLLLAPLILLASCLLKKQEPSISTHNDLNGINQISIEGYGAVHIKQGDQESLTVETTQEALKHITINTMGSSVVIKVDTEKMPKPQPDITFNFAIKSLTSLAVQGGMTIDAALADEKEFKFHASGSVHAALDLHAKALDITAHGASNVAIKGIVPQQNINLAGSAHYDARNLASETCTLQAHGATSAKLHCSKKIEGMVTGSSTLYYKDNPVVHVQALGASSIEKLS